MLPEIQGLQMDLGLARVAGDARVYGSLLLNLSRHVEDTLAEFEAACRDQDAGRLHRLAHKLKGVAGNLGAADLERWATCLEEMARQSFHEGVPACQAGLRACFRDLSRRILENLQDWPAAPGGQSPQPLCLDAHLQKLLSELDSSDGAALDTWSELATRLQGRLPSDEIARLGQLVQDFEFASARRALETTLI